MKTRLLLGVVGFCVGLLLVEGILRLTGRPSSHPFLQEFYAEHLKLMCYESDPFGNFDIDLRDPQQLRHYAALFSGDDFSQHWEVTPLCVELRINSLGFREREFHPKDPAVRRIVVIGDSFTVGHGLREADPYPRQLESLLHQQRSGIELEVFNAGVGGADLYSIAPTASWILENLQPDVLIYGYFLNDPLNQLNMLARGMEPNLDSRWLEIKTIGARLSIGAQPFGGPHAMEFLRRLVRNRRVTGATLDWYRDIHRPEHWAPTGQTIVQLARQSRRQNSKFILLMLPIIFQLDGNYPLVDVHQGLADFGEHWGIQTLDALPQLRGISDTELMLHPHDRHPNARYAGIVAEALAAALPGNAVSSKN